MRKRWGLGLACLLLCLLPACGQEEPSANDVPSASESPVETAPQKREADFSAAFGGIQGCAVLYDPGTGQWTFYQEEMCRQRVSPCSTFKIVSTLMGLHTGVLSGPESTMTYSGLTYPVAAWNQNLTLEQAFQSSCVWYFRQVIDQVGRQAVAEQLAALSYGNQDISQWAGSGQNERAELNGFWIDSSLKISPLEQVQVLATIFQGESQYTPEEVAILQEMMLVQDEGGRQVYGKTGTGFGETGWFVGFQQVGRNRTYFAVYLADEARTISGSDAKTVALKLLASVAECSREENRGGE